ncbi:MAG: ABC transporter ATP-binding protein [Clostridia bacterium]|nr:ABC transporter ATP-binding protein [Clostridia bacterium]MBQ9133202.1 ABC transporter ATP-binding protein [Clostridia bacterium]
MIVFENVTKAYDGTVLDNVTLNFEDGKITALLGVSGRGKTTVLRLLSGLEKADGGKVKASGKVGYLFQEHRLLPSLTAFENVRLVTDSDEDAKRALDLCAAASLSDKKPDEMSGGERQRVALARLAAFGGDIWLMDEPFSALDKDTKETVVKNLMPLMRAKTVVLVTHSDEEAAFADNIIRL